MFSPLGVNANYEHLFDFRVLIRRVVELEQVVDKLQAVIIQSLDNSDHLVGGPSIQTNNAIDPKNDNEYVSNDYIRAKKPSIKENAVRGKIQKNRRLVESSGKAKEILKDSETIHTNQLLQNELHQTNVIVNQFEQHTPFPGVKLEDENDLTGNVVDILDITPFRTDSYQKFIDNPPRMKRKLASQNVEDKGAKRVRLQEDENKTISVVCVSCDSNWIFPSSN
jgi:hypothetical protein